MLEANSKAEISTERVSVSEINEASKWALIHKETNQPWPVLGNAIAKASDTMVIWEPLQNCYN